MEENKIKKNTQYVLTKKLSDFLTDKVFVAYPYVMREKD